MKSNSLTKGTKRISQLIMLAAVALSGLPACTSDMDAVLDSGMPNTDSQATVIQVLQDYNDSISIPQSRGIGWVGWLSVAIADGGGAYQGAKLGGKIGAIFGPKGAAAGAVAGGVIVGGSASYVQYQRANDISQFSPYSLDKAPIARKNTFTAGYVETKDMIIPADYNLGISNGLDSCAVKIAIQHNKILDRVNLIEFENNQQLVIEKLDNLEREIVESTEFEIGYDRIISNPLSNNFDPDLTSDQVMRLFIEAVSNSCQSQEDLNRIISHYTSVVKMSDEISSEEKDWLYAGFAVMGYSFEYWSEKWPYEPE